MAPEESFTAEIKIAGINPYVDVPLGAAESLGGGAKLPALVKVAAASATKKRPAHTPGKLPIKDAARLKAIGRLADGGWFRSTVLARRSGDSSCISTHGCARRQA